MTVDYQLANMNTDWAKIIMIYIFQFYTGHDKLHSLIPIADRYRLTTNYLLVLSLLINEIFDCI
jgi:hypothetical protein